MPARLMCPLVVGALLSACAWTRDYPEAWTPLRLPALPDCRALAGSYANGGEGSKLGSALLARYLFDDWTKYAGATHVTLTPAAHAGWEATAWRSAERLVSRVFTATEARCEGGVLVVDGPWELVGGSGGIGRLDLTTRFQLADGYLVAQVTERMRGLAGLVVPVGFTLRHWYRFARRSLQERSEPTTTSWTSKAWAENLLVGLQVRKCPTHHMRCAVASRHGRDHHDFNKHPGSPKLGREASPRRWVYRIDPLIPDRIVVFEQTHVRNPYLGA